LARINAADVSTKYEVIKTGIIRHTTETIQGVFLVVMFSDFIQALIQVFMQSAKNFF